MFVVTKNDCVIVDLLIGVPGNWRSFCGLWGMINRVSKEGVTGMTEYVTKEAF